jgi:hypothetical protein
MTTKCPITYDSLIALTSNDSELDESAAAAVEDHAFACDRCSTAWTKLASIAYVLRETIPMVISHAHRERLIERGKRISITEVPVGVDTPARFSPELDLMVFALKADLTHVERLRVDIVSPDGSKRFIEEDVPFDRERGEVLIACQRHFEGMFESDPTFEVHAMMMMRDAGGDKEEAPRRLASYRVLHAWR